MPTPPSAPRPGRTFTAVTRGLMAWAATFLAERYVLKLGVDAGLIIATFVGVAVAVFLVQVPERR